MSAEVEEEIEVLRSIYDERLEVGDATRVRVGGICGRGFGLALDVVLPPGYPHDVPPACSVSVVSGKLPGGTEPLVRLLDAEARRQLGMPMVFALVTAAEDWAAALGRGAETSASANLAPDVAIAKPQEVFDGPLLTKESFAQWWPTFRDETLRGLVAAEEDALWALEHPGEATRPQAVVEASAAHPCVAARGAAQLTGKQMFEQGRARHAEAQAAEDEADALEDLSVLDSEAYAGLEDLAIDDVAE